MAAIANGKVYSPTETNALLFFISRIAAWSWDVSKNLIGDDGSYNSFFFNFGTLRLCFNIIKFSKIYLPENREKNHVGKC